MVGALEAARSLKKGQRCVGEALVVIAYCDILRDRTLYIFQYFKGYDILFSQYPCCVLYCTAIIAAVLIFKLMMQFMRIGCDCIPHDSCF